MIPYRTGLTGHGYSLTIAHDSIEAIQDIGSLAAIRVYFKTKHFPVNGGRAIDYLFEGIIDAVLDGNIDSDEAGRLVRRMRNVADSMETLLEAKKGTA